ncbi:methyltransferase domain-containing protein [bacterium]|nr:methyltransferase domain-containing protein [bacterium]
MTSAATSPPPQARVSFTDRWAERLVQRHLASLVQGALTLRTSDNVQQFGKTEELHAELQVHHPRFFRRASLGGRLAVAESYLEGDWDSDDLTSLFRIFLRNQSQTAKLDRGWARITELGHRLYHAWHWNSRNGSRRNIAAHYDLGNEFYKLWLDDTLAYSSGIFAASDYSLRDASLEKFDRVCRKLDLSPEDQVMEIGTGWGGFALHAASRFGCQITTTTISREQHAIASNRFSQAGMNQQIKLLQEDYRDLAGQFSKLVSIEMIEAVGHRYLDQFFQKCSQLLRPDGTMVLQAIVMPERGYLDYLKTVDFIQRYVFPGGCLPSVGSMLESAGRTTDLRLVHIEDFAPHYAETLRSWRLAFRAQLPRVRELGYPERLIRLWNYYLCYCEAAFEERTVGVVQIQFDKPLCRRDPLLLSHQAANYYRDRAAHHVGNVVAAVRPQEKSAHV